MAVQWVLNHLLAVAVAVCVVVLIVTAAVQSRRRPKNE
jgi:hypothetical protein